MISLKFQPAARLGNQLFEYAVCRSVAERNGYQYGFTGNTWLGGKMIQCDMGIQPSQIIVKHHFKDTPNQNYNPDIFNIQDFTEIEGYFQSDKYFNREDVKRWFKPTYPQSAYDFLAKYPIDKYGYINIRGTDQAVYPHLVLPREYYQRAMDIMLSYDNTLKFVIITDDIPLSKKTFPELDVYCNDRDTDFCVMNAAKYIIGGQSTFFWWAAYLNDNNIVVAPRGWFHYYSYETIGFGAANINTEKFIWIK